MSSLTRYSTESGFLMLCFFSVFRIVPLFNPAQLTCLFDLFALPYIKQFTIMGFDKWVENKFFKLKYGNCPSAKFGREQMNLSHLIINKHNYSHIPSLKPSFSFRPKANYGGKWRNAATLIQEASSSLLLRRMRRACPQSSCSL